MKHAPSLHLRSLYTSPLRRNSGVTLIVVLLILVVVSILGVSGIQVSMMGERGTRNDRDQQVAWQAAEAALIDAEFDIEGLPTSSTTKRNALFDVKAPAVNSFVQNCGNTGSLTGLCRLNDTGKPAWLTVDFTTTGSGAPTVQFGTFTGRDFPSGSKGIQPALPPRYVIEQIPDPRTSRTEKPDDRRYVYRVTAMGFGPNAETQAVVQMIYRN